MSERKIWFDKARKAESAAEVATLIDALWDRELEYLITLSPSAGGEKVIAALRNFLKEEKAGPTAPAVESTIRPSLYALRDSLERLFDNLELPAYLAEPSFADFETLIDASLRRVRNEADLAVKSCKWLQGEDRESPNDPAPITILRSMLNKHSGAFSLERLETVEQGIRLAKSLAEEVYYLSDSAAFRDRFNRAIHDAWEDVHLNVGSIRLRLRRPFYNFVWASMVTLAGYILIGSLSAVSFLLGFLVVVPLIAAVEADIAQWNSVGNVTRGVRDKLRRLAPSKVSFGGSLPDEGALWKAAQEIEIDGAINETFFEFTGQKTREVEPQPHALPLWSPRRVRNYLAASMQWVVTGANLALLVVVVWLISRSPWPERMVIAEVGLTRCLAGEGRVLWPGPFEMVLSEQGGVRAVDLDHVAIFLQRKIPHQLSRCTDGETAQLGGGLGDRNPPPIDDPPRSSSVVVWMPSFEAEQVETSTLAHEYLLTFAAKDVRGCSDRAAAAAGAIRDKELREMLRVLGRGLAACGATVDVKGYASSRPFNCRGGDATRYNWLLAESRRRSVIQYLRKGGADGYAIEKEKDDRFTDATEMEAERNRAYNDTDETGKPNRSKEIFTRAVVIDVKDFGSCEPIPARSAMN